MSKKGSRSDLHALHSKITRYYVHRVDEQLKIMDAKDSETDEDEDEFVMPLSPAELTAMNNFLKHNEVTADPEQDEGQSELQERLSKLREKGRKSALEVVKDVHTG